MDAPADKLDLYSIPVFLIELLILLGLAFGAHYLHFQYKPEPYLSGFYCDDISLRHEYRESTLTKQFEAPDNELVVLALLLAVPILVIIFCELVNSLFGSLKFRKIRALCKCCKLHSITRRTIRFAGAYILGFMLVMISCNVIANTTGHLKPYFAQECPRAFSNCPRQTGSSSSSSSSLPTSAMLNNGGLGGAGATGSSEPTNNWSAPSTSAPLPQTATQLPDNSTPSPASFRPPSAPISKPVSEQPVDSLPTPARLVRSRRDTLPSRTQSLLERKWIILDDGDLARLCDIKGDEIQMRRLTRLAMSWPSFPAAMVGYACIFIACYLSFVGTARPFRLLTSVLVVLVLLLGLIFDVQLVKEHYNHWEDVLAGSALSFVIVVFVLLVYLNKFRDSHYYANQKLHQKRNYAANGDGNNYNAYSNEIALEQFHLDKTEDQMGNHSGSQQNGDTGGSVPNNDLAMRYFQIPRANYRGSGAV